MTAEGLREAAERLLAAPKGVLGSITFLLTLESDLAVLPPWTGRTGKSVAMKLQCLEWAKRLYLERDRFRPVTFSVLHREDWRPIYKKATRSGGDPIVLRRGARTLLRVSFYSFTPTVMLQACAPESVDVGYARFHVEPLQMEFQSVQALPRTPLERVALYIVTPMTITSKILAPDLPPGSPLAEKVRGAPERYRLLPTPGYLVAQLVRQWMSLAGLDPGGSNLPKLLGRLADVLAAETHYNLRPVTVLYGRDEEGKTRLVRGVVGRLELEILDEWLGSVLRPLLAMGETLGVGKSRSMGFGEIMVEKSSGV